MKKQMLTLMVSATIFAGSPVFGMETPEESKLINPRKILSSYLREEIRSQKESPYGLAKALFYSLRDGARMWNRSPFQGKEFEGASVGNYYSTYDLQRIYEKEVNQKFVFSSGGSTGPASHDLSKLSQKFAKIIAPEVALSYRQKTCAVMLLGHYPPHLLCCTAFFSRLL
ncbi:MAG: hypothetical protein Q8858_15750 [Bacteroidota bacterium]|nr:hypothetical protein [Bacteroidota bacterium]